MTEEQEQQAELEQQLTQQTNEKIAAIKQQINDALDKFGTELMAHLKSTGQTKPKSSQDKEKVQEKDGPQLQKART